MTDEAATCRTCMADRGVRLGSILILLVASACALDTAPQPAPPSGPSTSRTAPASPAPSTTATAQPQVLLADLQGTIGPRGLPPAGGELSCRARAVLTIDMRPQPPFGRVRADFELDVDSCPDGTVLTEIHVHDDVPGHSERIYMGAAVEHPQPLIGGAGLVLATNGGVDPRVAADVLAEPGRFVIALHTERNPVGGAGRGVLRLR